jgi:hypothetical protein
MMRMIVLPIAANVIHVLDGVLTDLDRYMAIKLHEELRRSAAWRQGPREAIVSRIESDHTIVVEVSEEAIRALRQ